MGRAEELGGQDCAPLSAPELCHGTGGTVCCWDRGTCPCFPQIPVLLFSGTSPEVAVPIPGALGEGQGWTYADHTVWGADAGARGGDGGFRRPSVLWRQKGEGR